MSQEITIFNIIIYAFFSSVTMYTYHKIFTIMRAKITVTNKILYFAYSVFVLVSEAAYFLINNNIFNLIIGVVFLYLILLLYAMDNAKRLFFTLSITFSAMIIEVVVANFVCVIYSKNITEILLSKNLSFLCFVISKLLFLAAVQLYGYFSKDNSNKENITIAKQFSWQIIALPVISILLLYNVFEFSESSSETQAVSLAISMGLVMAINVLIFNLYDKIIVVSESRAENIILNKQIKYYFDLFKKINEEKSEMAQLRHNIKNEIISVNSSLMQGDLKEIKDKVNILLNSIPTAKIFVTNTPIVEAILHYKITQAGKFNIQIKYTVDISSDLVITDSDIANILGNLLDNSIEACAKLKENKIVNLSIKQDNNNLYINISNNYSGDVKFSDKIPITSKSDTSLHGIGVKTIKSIVEKYDGVISMRAKNNIFETEIIIFSAFQ